ncbi:hypothetical protein PHLCEN_2v12053 [Hermanssonia centrifuga]|uniref:F-box domain-containing protein n=1 Tax=Hermanssonia centrifuga TaxID=98765 RepID=A0A2R6NJ93_9APHY|nr:hypothetical protein PHLCEN_2v12053 [Hermanssonia centrifuga]
MFASKFATVTKLDLEMINLRTSRELVEFISSFHSLSYLTLSAMRCKKLRPNPARRVTQPLSRIEIIGTTGHCIANLLIFFHGANSHSGLIELDISPSESSVLDVSMDFIHGSVSLRHLTFSLCNLPESNSETGSLNLNSAMELRTLIFKAKYPVSHIAFLIRTLSTVRRSKLKEVVVHVNFGPELQDLDEEMLKNVDWDALDTILTTTHIPMLESVIICIMLGSQSNIGLDFFERRLPLLHGRGILTVALPKDDDGFSDDDLQGLDE